MLKSKVSKRKHMGHIIKKTVILLLVINSVFIISSCGKKNIPDFVYEKNESGEITITGLTDKGRAQEKLTIPAVLDGSPVKKVASGFCKDNLILKSVVIEEGITYLAENAFLSCCELREISFPSSIEYIGTNAFTQTRWLSEKFQTEDALIVNDILVKVKEGVVNYDIPEGVKKIAGEAFAGNDRLESVTLSSSVESIGNYVFNRCTALKNVTIPATVKKIGYGAFNECVNLNVMVDDGVKEISPEAFYNVMHLEYNGNLTGAPWGAKAYN